jgi:hypothetical protein
MDLSGSYSPLGHCGQSASAGVGQRVSISLHPLAPPALPGFIATTGALTPARPMDLLANRSPCFMQPTFRALRLQPPTRSDGRFSNPAFAGAGSNPSAPPASPARARVWASPLDRRLARRYGRNEFLIVRMALSLPVASHPASRRRSYSQLQAGVGIPGGRLAPP